MFSTFAPRLQGSVARQQPTVNQSEAAPSPAPWATPLIASVKESKVIPAAAEKGGAIKFITDAFGGALCCAVTHSAVVPIDVVKTRMQLEPGRYPSLLSGFRMIAAEEGAMMLMQGVGPTFVGYAMQGAFKFGFYEFFKGYYADVMPNPTLRYLASAASAEFFADLALCPMEATRIRLVAQPDFAKGLPDAFAKILRNEGVGGFYKGLVPILFKQIPYTMTKFVVYENVSTLIYKFVEKENTGVGGQLVISLGSGVVAGIASAIVSQPADTILSVVNKQKDDSGAVRQIVRIFRQMSAKELFAGLGARCVMVGTLTAGQFFIFNAVKFLA
eukprot:TRINITY_DN18328_c0_g1_i1.p1 TRINITY_DN18328_c0_g1~~TRINITY_DN18328_c0_g1_i1.p1  ORF type:complete len:359 (+),score=134.57 TRINITY_DN18328_c0_g1_i1:90-1079(+)